MILGKKYSLVNLGLTLKELRRYHQKKVIPVSIEGNLEKNSNLKVLQTTLNQLEVQK
jgi:hypothetical protein